MTEFLQLLFQGISLGSTYALVALGFVVVYRASGVINFAQGAMLLVGAYAVSWLAVDVGLAFLPAVLAATVLLALGGAGLHRLVLRRVAGQPAFVLVMITIGAGIALTSGVEAVFGPDRRLLGDPWGSSSVEVAGVTMNTVNLWGIAVTLAALGAYFAFDRWSRWGLAMQATAGDEEATLSVGVPVRRVHAYTWALAGALATLGGLFLAGFPGAPQPTLGDAALRAFPAIVLGGLTSPVGAVVGGVLIGVVEVLTSGYAPVSLGTNFYAVAPYLFHRRHRAQRLDRLRGTDLARARLLHGGRRLRRRRAGGGRRLERGAPAAGLVAGACGALVGPVALRLRGLYLAIVTLGLVFIGQHVFFNAASLTGGPQGRTFPPVVIGPFDFSPGQVLRVGGLAIDHNGLYYYLALVLLAAATTFAWNLRRTRTGRAMVAVREREAAAAVMGVDVGRVKVVAFTLSAFLAGVSGALYASYLSFAQPGEWSLLLSIQFIAAVIVGGMGTVAGPIVGSAVVFALPRLLENLPFLPAEGSGGVSVSDLSSIAYGLLIVVFLVFEPRGLVGLAKRADRLHRWRSARAVPIRINQPEEAHP